LTCAFVGRIALHKPAATSDDMNARRKFVVIGIALVSVFRERAKKIPATAFMLWEIVGIPYDSVPQTMHLSRSHYSVSSLIDRLIGGSSVS
jgi:hypothetical protein